MATAAQACFLPPSLATITSSWTIIVATAARSAASAMTTGTTRAVPPNACNGLVDNAARILDRK